MADYDFHQLSPHDMELLSRDLLQAEHCIVLESFKSGRDGGIDLRYARAGKLIVQVKHFAKTGLSGLLSALRKEAGKIPGLKPDRYMVITSVSLTPKNKAQIVDAVGGQHLNVADVLGAEDLNNLLERHPGIHQQHFKLWLGSRAVLDRVIHNEVLVQTDFQVRRIQKDIPKYVPSSAYGQALQILERDRLLILSGPPGVGKTTLAELLLYHHLADGWEPVVIRRDVAEGARLMQPGKRQVFYFDDFMGATFLGDRGAVGMKQDDRALVDFMGLIGDTPSARLILTTREHIFGQALTASERLRDAGLDSRKLVLRVSDYTRSERALILYNHLYYSDLPDAYREALLANDFYLRIIQHEKFNPRLVAWLSTYNRVAHVPTEAFAAHVEKLLRDPSKLWLHAYDVQIGEAGRSLLMALFSFGGEADGVILEPAFRRLHGLRAERYGFAREAGDFRLAMSQVINAFVRPDGAKGFAVLDPSVLDLMNAVLRRDPDDAVAVALGAIEYGQIERIIALAVAADGKGVFAGLEREPQAFMEAVGRCLGRKGRIVTRSGKSTIEGFTVSSRLLTLLKLRFHVRSPEFRALREQYAAEIVANMEAGAFIYVSHGVDMVRALDGLAPDDTESRRIIETMPAYLLAQTAKEPSIRDVSELVSLLDLDEPESQALVVTLKEAGAEALAAINSELLECRTGEDFSGVRDDIEFIAKHLELEVAPAMDVLEETEAEYQEREEAYADSMMDEHKDRMREGRASDGSVRDLFGSLRSDS